MNGFEPIKECVFQYTDAGQSRVDFDTQIVRCKDCKFFDTRKCKSQWPFRLDGFCAWGERGEDK